MHHSGPSLAETSNMPAGGLRVDAGVLAARTPHEEEHQGHPHPPSELGQGISGLSGYSRLGLFPPDRSFPKHLLRWAERMNVFSLLLDAINLLFSTLTVLTTKTLRSFQREAMCTSPSVDTVWTSFGIISFSLSISLGLFPSFCFVLTFFVFPASQSYLSFLIDLASALLLTLHRQRP